MNAGNDWLSSRALATRHDCADPPLHLSEGLVVAIRAARCASCDSLGAAVAQRATRLVVAKRVQLPPPQACADSWCATISPR
jgi:hypothetical protein